MNLSRFAFCALVTVLVLAAGCLPRVGRRPLSSAEGWKQCWSQDPSKLDKAIRDDYLEYIQELPPKKRSFIGRISLFEDGTGEHAVDIEQGINGTYWKHVLIYD